MSLANPFNNTLKELHILYIMLQITQKSKRTLVMTGGGTAGHVIPNIALLPLLEPHFTIHYIGSANGIERTLIAAHPQITYHAIQTAKLRRSLSPKSIASNIATPLRVMSGIARAKKILRTIKPDLVFSKGGFVAYPVVRAAASLKIPAIIHESDLTMGLANRMSARHATQVLKTFNGDGTPIRRQIYRGWRENIDYNFTNQKNLLVVGGSLGASVINSAIINSTKILTDDGWNILHICGRNKVNNNANVKNYVQLEYMDNIHDALAWADVVVSRAGSNALCELIVLGKPTLFTPLATGRGDQIQNAKFIESKNAAVVLPESQLTPRTLVENIDNVFKDKEKLSKNALELGKTLDGTKGIAHAIIDKF